MKIFCDDHGQPLTLDELRSEYSCKIAGCLVAVSVHAAEALSASILPRVRITEIWVEPK